MTANHRVTLAVQVNGTANSAVNWTVNAQAGGNSSVGQICIASSNPCTPVTSSNAPQVNYLAPGSPLFPNPVTVQASRVAFSAKTGSAQITVINHDLVSVLPGSAIIAPDGVQAFSATVLGTLPANPISLPVTPPNITGIYGAQVVAVDVASGAVMAGTIGGWSCSAAGPTNFDGGYQIQKLPIGRRVALRQRVCMALAICDGFNAPSSGPA